MARPLGAPTKSGLKNFCVPSSTNRTPASRRPYQLGPAGGGWAELSLGGFFPFGGAVEDGGMADLLDEEGADALGELLGHDLTLVLKVLEAELHKRGVLEGGLKGGDEFGGDPGFAEANNGI